MGSVANMKQRVATAEAILKATSLSERNRDAWIIASLETVEKNIAHKQQQISDLEEERNRALDEVQHLRGLLNVMLENTAYAKATKRRGDKKPFLNPTIILVACVLMIGFILLNW